MDVGGAALLVLRTGRQGHGSQQEHRRSQSHREFSHQTLLLFAGLPQMKKSTTTTASQPYAAPCSV
jgi:hypothetical protein